MKDTFNISPRHLKLDQILRLLWIIRTKFMMQKELLPGLIALYSGVKTDH